MKTQARAVPLIATIVLFCAMPSIASSVAQANGACGGQVIRVQEGSQSDQGSLPVLFVHGMDDDTDHWQPAGQPRYTDPANPEYSWSNSLLAKVRAVPTVSEWLFDYANVSLHWVTDPQIGSALAQAITCIAERTGHKVVVVTYSMGGLATQLAVSQPASAGGLVADHVAEVVTVANPSLGSLTLTVAQAAISGTEVASVAALKNFLLRDGVEGFLSACAALAKGGHARELHNTMCEYTKVLRSPVGSALLYGSPTILQLPKWPANLPILPIAGDISLQTNIKVYNWDSPPIPIGDGVVSLDSATASAIREQPFTVPCTLDNVLHILSNACFHRNLVANSAVQNKIVEVVQQNATVSVVPCTNASGTGLPTTIPNPGTTALPAGTGLYDVGVAHAVRYLVGPRGESCSNMLGRPVPGGDIMAIGGANTPQRISAILTPDVSETVPSTCDFGPDLHGDLVAQFALGLAGGHCTTLPSGTVVMPLSTNVNGLVITAYYFPVGAELFRYIFLPYLFMPYPATFPTFAIFAGRAQESNGSLSGNDIQQISCTLPEAGSPARGSSVCQAALIDFLTQFANQTGMMPDSIGSAIQKVQQFMTAR